MAQDRYRHVNAHTRFEELAGYAVVTDYADAGDEVYQATHLALTDLSTLPRTGFKGARGWLEEHGAQLPNSPNQAAQQEDGSLIARLSIDELLILSDLNSDATLPAILQDR